MRQSGPRRARLHAAARFHHDMNRQRSSMKKLTTCTLLGIAALIFTSAANAQVEPEDQIRFRKAAYSFAAWNSGKIKANLGGNFDAAQVRAAANAIAAVANSGMGALYGPGSEKSIGNQKTTVKPELFTSGAEVAKLAGNFSTAANELVKAAESGDVSAVKTAYDKLGQSCKACHDQFRTR
jgi:cytochrome c556